MSIRHRTWFAIKWFAVLSLCLLCPSVLWAQAAPDQPAPPGIVLLDQGRYRTMQRTVPVDWVVLEKSYPVAPGSRQSRIDGMSIRLPTINTPYPKVSSRPLWVYTLQIKNIGTKKVAGLVWDYVIVGTASEKELARLQFRNQEKVGVNRSITLQGTSLEPPHLPVVTTVEELQKEGGTPERDMVEIKCILYSDGTWWRHPSVGASDCRKAKQLQTTTSKPSASARQRP